MMMRPRLLAAPTARPWRCSDGTFLMLPVTWTDLALNWPEVVPLRCRSVRGYGAYILRCFLDKDHAEPCHY
jgi:hypothetical protein